MPAVTIKDVAEHAQVSIATVDRVLHDRNGVSAKARNRVKEAVREMGFGQLPKSLTRYSRGRLRFLFLLPSLETGFVVQMVDAIRRAQAALPAVEVLIDIKRVSLGDGSDLIAALEAPDIQCYDGVGLFAVDAPGVRTSIDDVVASGLPVVTIVSDVPNAQRSGFAGIDNVAAGRTAARLMGRFLRGVSGEVGIIMGDMSIRDHVERHLGFRQILGADYRDLKPLAHLEGGSYAARNRAHVMDLLADTPRLAGLYSIGAGNSGIIAALKDVDPARRPVTIMHELTSDTRTALKAGWVDAVIGQDTGHIARSAVRQLAAKALGDDTNPEQERIRIDVFLAENLL